VEVRRKAAIRVVFSLDFGGCSRRRCPTLRRPSASLGVVTNPTALVPCLRLTTAQVMGPEALLKQKIKQKRHREGYEDGLSSSHK
jgi:hypothetical protein